MAKKEISDSICRPFCSFYRVGEKEELICRGARIVELLQQSGAIPPSAFDPESLDTIDPLERNPFLDQTLCGRCVFRADDCDFQSDAYPSGSEPCGGYIVLNTLLSRGIVTPEELENLDDQ